MNAYLDSEPPWWHVAVTPRKLGRIKLNCFRSADRNPTSARSGPAQYVLSLIQTVGGPAPSVLHQGRHRTRILPAAGLSMSSSPLRLSNRLRPRHLEETRRPRRTRLTIYCQNLAPPARAIWQLETHLSTQPPKPKRAAMLKLPTNIHVCTRFVKERRRKHPATYDV